MIGPCDICGKTWMELNRHHILSRGAGNHDVPEAMLTICVTCHSHVHNGAITRDAQLGIALGRDRPELIEEVKQKVWDTRRGI
jgi:cytochrome c553